MTVMSEGLLPNSKHIKIGREEGGFQALLTQLPLVFYEDKCFYSLLYML